MSQFADSAVSGRVHFGHSLVEGGVDLVSVSSVGAESDRGGREDSLAICDEATPLYVRLKELDQLTSTFLMPRPLVLQDVHDTFADLEPQKQQLFELTVPELAEEDVLCICVSKLSRGKRRHSTPMRSMKLPIEESDDAQDDLSVSFRLSKDSNLVDGYPKGNEFDSDNEGQKIFSATAFEGSYDLVLTAAHGLTAGKYILDVVNERSSDTVSFRVKHTLTKQVVATPIQARQTIRGSVSANEFMYFRFVSTDPSKAVTIRARPTATTSSSGSNRLVPAGDPDLYVTNKYNGLVALDKESAIWKSTTVGVDRVDILPNDPESRRGNIYIIGVLGCKKRNDFELSVSLEAPEAIMELPICGFPRYSQIEGGNDTTAAVQRGKYTYFEFPVDPTSCDKLIIKIEPCYPNDRNKLGAEMTDHFTVSATSDSPFVQPSKLSSGYQKSQLKSDIAKGSVLHEAVHKGRDDQRVSSLVQRFGRGIYSEDWFAEYGVYDSLLRENHSEGSTPYLAGFSSFSLAFGKSAISNLNSSEAGEGSMNWKGTGYNSSPDASFTSDERVATPGITGFSDSFNALNSPTAAAYIKQKSSNEKDTVPHRMLHTSPKENIEALSELLKVEQEALPVIFPPSVCRDVVGGIYPVAYLSSSCKYPSEENYTWRASAADGCILFVLDMKEWKYTSHTCYLSVFGLSLPEAQCLASINSDNDVKSSVVFSQGLDLKISSWTREETYSMTERNKKDYKIFNKIFADIDGSLASQFDRSTGVADNSEVIAPGARKRVALENDQCFTYGEIEFPSFLKILSTAKATDGQIFVDLGCGAGKALVAASLSDYHFLRCVGIELLPSLADCSRKALSKLREFDTEVQNTASAGSLSLSRTLPLLVVKEGDILDTDWSDADLVYISSICFPEHVLIQVFEKATKLKIGSTVITLKLVPGFESFFELSAEKWYKMTWGSILVYFLTRV